MPYAFITATPFNLILGIVIRFSYLPQLSAQSSSLPSIMVQTGPLLIQPFFSSDDLTLPATAIYEAAKADSGIDLTHEGSFLYCFRPLSLQVFLQSFGASVKTYALGRSEGLCITRSVCIDNLRFPFPCQKQVLVRLAPLLTSLQSAPCNFVLGARG